MMRALLIALAGVGVFGAGADHAQSLDDAFRRERVNLEAERDALADETTRFETESAAQIAAAARRVDALRAELEAVRDRLAGAADGGGEAASADVEAALVAHAAHAERVLGSSASGTLPVVERGRAALDLALAALDRGTRVRWDEGRYFLPDGTESSGRVLELGAVARVAEVGGRLAPLVPVSEGTFEARLDRAVPAGSTEIPVVVAGETGIDRAAPRSLGETLRAGGPIVWPILALALLGVILVIERTWTIHRLERGRAAMEEVVKLVEAGTPVRAAERAAAAGGAGGRVLGAGLEERGRGTAAVDDALSEALIRESARFHRFLPVIRVIAAVSPLLGLLGTVTGMISTFDAITTFGTGDPKLLSGGISEALITTELGLTVAIPFLFVHNILAGRVHRNESELEERSLALSRALSTSMPTSEPGGEKG